jgi:hypothetical protein
MMRGSNYNVTVFASGSLASTLKNNLAAKFVFTLFSNGRKIFNVKVHLECIVRKYSGVSIIELVLRIA